MIQSSAEIDVRASLLLVHSVRVTWTLLGFLGGSDGKESTCNAGDLGSIPGLERSPGEGSGYPLQYSGLENSVDRGAWQTTVHEAKSVGHD